MATGAGLIFLTTVVTAILRQLLQTRALHDWQLMTLSGARIADATRVPASVDGVTKIDQLHDDSE
jgi:hypothetical protein